MSNNKNKGEKIKTDTREERLAIYLEALSEWSEIKTDINDIWKGENNKLPRLNVVGGLTQFGLEQYFQKKYHIDSCVLVELNRLKEPNIFHFNMWGRYKLGRLIRIEILEKTVELTKELIIKEKKK